MFTISENGKVYIYNSNSEALENSRKEQLVMNERMQQLQQENEKPVAIVGTKKHLYEVTACNRIPKTWYKNGKGHSFEKDYFNTITVLASSMTEAKSIYKSIFSTVGLKVYAYRIYELNSIYNGSLDGIDIEYNEAISENAKFIVACALRNACNGATTASHISFFENMRKCLFGNMPNFDIDDLLSTAKLAFIEMENSPVYMAVAYAFSMVNNYMRSMAWNNDYAGKIFDITDYENSIAVSAEIEQFIAGAKQENGIILRAVASLYRAGKLTEKQAVTLFDYIILCDYRTGNDKATMRMLAKREGVNVSSVYKRIAQARYNIAKGLLDSRYERYLPCDIRADKEYYLSVLRAKAQAR